MFVHLALPVPVFKTFTYAVPPEHVGRSLLGIRALVPFGQRTFTGVIVGQSETTDVPKVRPLLDLLDETPIFSPEMLRFAEWMSEYYLSPLGETLRSMLPQGMTPESTQKIMLASPELVSRAAELRRTAPRQAAIIVALGDHPKGIALSTLQKKVGGDSLYSQLVALEQKGLIVRSVKDAKGATARSVRGVRITPALFYDDEKMHALFDLLDASAPKQAAIMSLLYTQAERTDNAFVFAGEVLEAAKAPDSALKGLKEKGAIEIEQIEVSREEILSPRDEEPEESTIDHRLHDIVPNAAQAEAIGTVIQSIDAGEFRTYLLHGVTGSGKTQVYIEAIRHAIRRGKRAIMLVPEIALTFQLVERFTSVFGERIAVLHSRLSDGERYDAWQRAAAGGCDVVIGPRSALFAPLRNVGIIVVDEEHESSYKQYDAQPRYNARDAAIVRARFEGGVALLGSATPSIESYYNTQQGKYQLLELPERVDNAREPKIVIVDTQTARKQNLMRGSISVRMLHDIRGRLTRKEGVILFQNRRGFATRLECASCAHSPVCPHCAVTLTFHKQLGELRCHYCGFMRPAERECEVCGNYDLRQPGIGTQKVEEELAAQLPEAKIVRMDLDTTTKKGSHRQILASFARGEIDILLGTQMVAKGLDFSRVSLVGVVSADTQLLLPDFRASERTYQLLTQVAGRAGRRGNMEGEVVIQTSNPNHPAVLAAFSKNYMMMYNDELQTRRELDYPPFSRFVVLEFRSEDQKAAETHARIFREMLPSNEPALQILGPTPALISKLRNQYRFQIVVKNLKAIDPGGKIFARIFSSVYERYRASHGKSAVTLIIDIDAQGSM
jgi:primosomal protein N' (replication factor Y) (superfamily II helicase)